LKEERLLPMMKMLLLLLMLTLRREADHVLLLVMCRPFMASKLRPMGHAQRTGVRKDDGKRGCG